MPDFILTQTSAMAELNRAGPKDADDRRHSGGTGLVVEEAPPKLKKPRQFKVLMLNDDYTPMEFVVLVLEKLFRLSKDQAVEVMLSVHQKGKGVCGVFTREIAETKVAQTLEMARSNEHPLQCTLEEA